MNLEPNGNLGKWGNLFWKKGLGCGGGMIDDFVANFRTHCESFYCRYPPRYNRFGNANRLGKPSIDGKRLQSIITAHNPTYSCAFVLKQFVSKNFSTNFMTPSLPLQ